MAKGFNKFDPAAPAEDPNDPESEAAGRRALILKYGWLITTIYTAMGFGLIVYWSLKQL